MKEADTALRNRAPDPRAIVHSVTATISIALLAFTAAQAKTRLPTEKDAWLRGDSANFTVFSNASDKTVLRTLRELEQFRAALGANSKGMDLRSPLPTWIYLFKTDNAFRPYKLTPEGKPDSISGFFQPSVEANYVALDISAGLRVVYHEYVHYFIENNVPDLPLWANEGLAEYYSTFRTVGDVQETGLHIDGHLAWLATNSMQPIPELFSVDARSPEYNEGQRKGTFYAQSWALVHYILSTDDDKRARFNRWVTGIANGNDPDGSFWSVFETDPETLGKALEDYVKQRRYGFYKRPAVEVDEAGMEVRSLDYVETLVRLGDMLAHRRPLHAESAEAHLRKALKISPDHPRASIALARLRETQGRAEEADALFAKALAKGGDDAEVLAAVGSRKIRAWYGDGPTRRLVEAPAELLEARGILRRALELDPDQPEAVQWIGKTYPIADDTFEEGLAAQRRAIERFPQRVDLIADMIVTLANGGRVDEASMLLETAYVRRAEDRSELGELRRILDNGRYNVAIRAANDGDLETAIALLETLEGSSTRTLAEQAAETRARLTATRDHNRVVAVYNEAIALANDGRFDAAREKLKPLLESPPADEALASAIRSLNENLADR